MALSIQQPTDGFTYYSNLVDFSVTWDPLTNICKWGINDETNYTFSGCADSFIIDVPYNNGTAKITLFSLNSTGHTISSTSTTIEIQDPQTTAKGLVAFGSILFALFVPVFLLLCSVIVSGLELRDEQKNEAMTEHYALRFGFLFAAIVMLIPAYNAVNVALRQYIHSDVLTSVLTPFYYNWLVIIFIFYLFMYIVYKSFMRFKESKHKTGEY